MDQGTGAEIMNVLLVAIVVTQASIALLMRMIA